MMKLKYLKSVLAGGASTVILAGAAHAREFNIPGGDLASALNIYSSQTGVQLIYAETSVKGIHTRGVKGDLSADDALSRILAGTDFVTYRHSSTVIGITRNDAASVEAAPQIRLAQATPVRAAAAGIESVVVTSSKIKGDIQTVPIAITALSQEQLTSRQIAGGPDLVKEVPNLTFSKTNFTGYNIQIRGIGTQAISVTTDPAVAVAFNDMPFIRNHFFEQEFYDVGQVEVLRGPQGTLYGRNATAGVVNVISAKPTDQFESMLSADIGNYHNRRFEGMINIPVVDDRLDIRVAAEWTKRDGYSFNSLTNAPIDGRDLWSSRVSVGWKPVENLQAMLVWEHFQESDDRMRTAKQLCKTDPTPVTVGGQLVAGTAELVSVNDPAYYLTQGCRLTSLYSPDAFEVVNGLSLPYGGAAGVLGVPIRQEFDPYSSTTQSRNLRVIESALDPVYKAKNDVVELNVDYNITPALTFTSQTGYNHDFLWSTEDYNRFNTAPGFFECVVSDHSIPCGSRNAFGQLSPEDDHSCDSAPVGEFCAVPGIFCDPQLGCSDRLVAEDLSEERAWQLSQEFRLASNFSGPLNFSVGGNYLHYETEENYYVFINALTLLAASALSGASPQPPSWVPGVSDNSQCLPGGFVNSNPFAHHDPQAEDCIYIDPNPIAKLNNKGHNYFLSQNPYVLNSYAGFGEAYYNVLPDLKLISGLRWTEDQKHFTDIPSEVVVAGYGYASTGVVDQQWNKLTGRFAVNWTPKLDFTDQSLLYGSYAHGYKAGGANPPGAVLLVNGCNFGNACTQIGNPVHPLTFKPEFVDAFELGTKNTLLDGSLTLNGDIFYYDYKSYQISEIVDRTSINLNFDATVKGAELETTWEPAPGLKFTFAGGYENARLAKGDHAVDLMDRTAGNPNWIVVRPFVTQASNCILPVYVIAAILENGHNGGSSSPLAQACGLAYSEGVDPPIQFGNTAPPGYPGFDPVSPTATNNGAGPVPNEGEGFDKDLSGNDLPNAPHFTTSLSADYTMPVSEDWAATLHSDFYWQSQSFARVFNDRPYDKLRGYSSVNLALIVTSANGWQVMGYLKNVFDTTAITGTFLNSDDSGLTTNVFLTDPRLYGVRVTKNF